MVEESRNRIAPAPSSAAWWMLSRRFFGTLRLDIGPGIGATVLGVAFVDRLRRRASVCPRIPLPRVAIARSGFWGRLRDA